MGTDAIIGEIDLRTLIQELYHLDELNTRYDAFIEGYRAKKYPNLWGASLYLSILRDDPQLPRPLLPKDWLGDKAYELATKLYPSLHL